jgi:hypothetical protein
MPNFCPAVDFVLEERKLERLPVKRVLEPPRPRPRYDMVTRKRMIPAKKREGAGDTCPWV